MVLRIEAVPHRQLEEAIAAEHDERLLSAVRKCRSKGCQHCRSLVNDTRRIVTSKPRTGVAVG
jgi:hypothetical protein